MSWYGKQTQSKLEIEPTVEKFWDVSPTGWRRCIGGCCLQVSFRKRAKNYRALLQHGTYKDKAYYASLPFCFWVACVTCQRISNVTSLPHWLQHAATHYEHTAMHCDALHFAPKVWVTVASKVDVLKRQLDTLLSATLQHTATHCNTLQHTATRCSTLQHTAIRCNTLQHTATLRFALNRGFGVKIDILKR